MVPPLAQQLEVIGQQVIQTLAQLVPARVTLDRYHADNRAVLQQVQGAEALTEARVHLHGDPVRVWPGQKEGKGSEDECRTEC